MRKRLAILALLAAVLVPETTHAISLGVNLDNPDLNTIPDVLANLIRLGLLFAASIGGIFIVVSGYQYVMSAGNPEKLEKAKMGLTWAIAGFILAISAFAIVLMLQGVLQAKPEAKVDKSLKFFNIKIPSSPSEILEQLMQLLLIFGGAAALLFLIVGGYRYVTSQGDRDAVEKAKKTILYAVIGLITVMVSTLIFTTFSDQLDFKKLTPF